METTPGDHTEASQTLPLIEQHETNTQREVQAAIAERGYGTVENYCELIEHGIRPHISSLQPPGHKANGLFTKEDFRYDVTNDNYICPAGQRLNPKRKHARRQMTDYVADKKTCAQCPLREQCTTSKLGRSVARHWKEETLEIAHACARQPEAYQDRARRRHLMEGSFAQATNLHHFKNSRWRRLWRQKIQDWLIAAVQNIAILCGKTKLKVPARLKTGPKSRSGHAPRSRLCRFGANGLKNAA